MTDTDSTTVPRTPAGVGSWLRQRVAYYTGLPVEEIGSDGALADYGLDSVYAFALCGDIEEAFGLAVEPTLLWDVETLTALTEHIIALVADPSE